MEINSTLKTPEDRLCRRAVLSALSTAFLCGFAGAALALNPQPLPPGLKRAPTNKKGASSGARQHGPMKYGKKPK